MAHSILLVQATKSTFSRTFSDYESVNECMELGVCRMFEEHLKKANPESATITYDIAQLFEYIDSLWDMSMMVFQKSTSTYAPRNKEWIKEKVHMLLRGQAGQAKKQ